MKFSTRIWKILTSPSAYFDTVRGETGYKAVFIYSALLALIPLIIMILAIPFDLPFIVPFLGRSEINPISSIVIPIGRYLVLLGGPFIAAGILHPLIKFARGEGSYSVTYRVVAYSLTPAVILSWIQTGGGGDLGFILIGMLQFWWPVFLLIMGISNLHNITRGTAMGIVIIAGFIVGAIVAVVFFLGMHIVQ